MPLVARPLYGPEFEMFRAVPLVSPAATTRPLPEGGGGSGVRDGCVVRARTGVFGGPGFGFVCGGNFSILSLVRVVLPMANSRRMVSLPAYIPHAVALWPPKITNHPHRSGPVPVPLRSILCQDLERLPYLNLF